MSQKEKIAEELNKLKRMTWKQRIGYVWDYYKLGFVVLFFLAMLVSLVATMVRNANTKVLMNAVFFNCDYVDGDTEGFVQAFEESLGGIEKNEKITIDFTLTLDPDVWDTARTATETKVTAYNMTGELDGMVMDEAVYRQYQTNGMLQKMGPWLTEEQLAKWKDYLVWSKEPVGEEVSEEETAGEKSAGENPAEAETAEAETAGAETAEAETAEAESAEAESAEAESAEADGQEEIPAHSQESRASVQDIYGIRVDSSKVLKQYGLYQDNGEPVILSMPGNSDDPEYMIRLLEFLLESE